MNITWLASYPKSGNTWFRIFLKNLLSETDEPIDINAIHTGAIASARAPMDKLYGIDSNLLSQNEIDTRRPSMYNHWADQATETQFHKVHDAYTYLPDGRPLLGEQKEQKAIYLVRNPLDVTVSYANHAGHKDFNKAAQALADTQMAFCKKTDRFNLQLRQHLLSWSQHVLSWIDGAKMPLHIIRYEDMVSTPLQTFTAACKFAGLTTDADKISKAIERSSMSRLQKLEQTNGFKERPARCSRFFRKGGIGSYKENLTEQQVQNIIHQHRNVMERLGYLEAGQLKLEKDRP